MGDPLRERRPLLDLAENQQIVEISEKIGNFEGLARVLQQDLFALDAGDVPVNWRDALVTGRLEFGFADGPGKVPTLIGSLHAEVVAVCQRCLEPFRMPLSSTFSFVLDGHGSTALPDDEFEVWEIAADLVAPIEIVEEVLLMTMPLYAMHEGQCIEIEAEADEGRMTTPFRSLRRRMSENKSD